MFDSLASIALFSSLLSSLSVGGIEIIRPEPPERYFSWEGLVYLLGGVEASLGTGSVDVTSLVRFDGALREPVASGSAIVSTQSIGLYAGPVATGWRFAPTGGWLNQSVYISDFAQDLPYDSSDPTTIQGTCSDPETGDTIECALPNAYSMDLQSFYGGLLVGYDFVFGGPRVHVISGTHATFNALEYRRADVHLARRSVSGSGWIFARSLGAAATLGLYVPNWRLSFRGSIDYSFFGNFGFGEGIEFRGPVVYDEERAVHYRPRLEVDEARLSAYNVKFSIGYRF